MEIPVSTGQTWVMGMKKVEMEERGLVDGGKRKTGRKKRTKQKEEKKNRKEAGTEGKKKVTTKKKKRRRRDGVCIERPESTVEKSVRR